MYPFSIILTLSLPNILSLSLPLVELILGLHNLGNLHGQHECHRAQGILHSHGHSTKVDVLDVVV